MTKDIKSLNVLGNWIMRMLSLLFLYMLSYQYDGYWTYALGGACLVYLGIEIGKSRLVDIQFMNKDNSGGLNGGQ